MEPAEFDPQSMPPAGREESARHTLQLNSLMLVIAVIAVCLGVLHEVPGLGILLFILVIPALLRTFVGARRRQALGRSMSVGEKLLAFLGSVSIVAVIGLAASIAFAATCIPTGFMLMGASQSTWSLVFAVLAGLTVAGYVLFVLGRRLWPERDR